MMAFVNATLLLGGLFTAVPIIVHLLMRRQPVPRRFPALRLLRARRDMNQRRLQLRHWLLLAFRCACILALALAMARPSVGSASLSQWLIGSGLLGLWLLVAAVLVYAAVHRKGAALVAALAVLAAVLAAVIGVLLWQALQGGGDRLGSQREPVAAVLLFDTSPRMGYRFQNRTRLETAQSMAGWLIRQLPERSDVAVLDARPGPAVFAVDLAAAQKAVDRLLPTGLAAPLPDGLATALRLVESSAKARKEIYLFTDLSAGAWKGDDSGATAELLGNHPDVSLYLIDVGVEKHVNTALGDLHLSADSVAENGTLEITTTVARVGTATTVGAEVYLEPVDTRGPVLLDGQLLLPEPRRLGRRELQLEDGQAAEVTFTLHDLEPGLHQGTVRLDSQDGLEADNQRHFAVQVVPVHPLLVVAAEGVQTSFLVEAVAPFEFRETDQASYECSVVTPDELANLDLARYSAVCLLDPPPLAAAVWQSLGAYVESGGGLAVFLGHLAESREFSIPEARTLLGGRLARQWRAGGFDLYLAPQQYDHPILAAFRELATGVPWQASPVFRHWVLDPLEPETRVIMRYVNNQPALVEVAHGRGRSLVMTTPVSDPPQPRGRASWNELPTSDLQWPYFVLINELIEYLVDQKAARLNYRTGEPAVLPNGEQDPARYQLFVPGEEPQEVPARRESLVLHDTERPGAYRLKGDQGGLVVRGFAVNIGAEHSELRRLDRERLDAVLGKDRYRLADSRDEIEFEVGHERVGQEFYPYLLALLAVVLSMEYALANRFYRKAA